LCIECDNSGTYDDLCEECLNTGLLEYVIILEAYEDKSLKEKVWTAYDNKDM